MILKVIVVSVTEDDTVLDTIEVEVPEGLTPMKATELALFMAWESAR